ncbi:hypothetical protein LCGC14_1329390, partial [marine sediment metagenome]
REQVQEKLFTEYYVNDLINKITINKRDISE